MSFEFKSVSPLNPALALGAAVLAACLISPAQAAERRFTYVYETTTLPKGGVEFEQWITWKTEKASDPSYDRFDIRHELEFGLTDRLQLGLYLSDWRYESGDNVDDGATWRNVAVEFKYALTDPTVDVIGSALYGEVKIGDEFFELEGKILLQKNVGKWVFAWNGIAEAEWEGEDYSEDKAKFAQTLGASYQFSPQFLAGFEMVHEVGFDDWSDWGDHVVYIGPNASYRAESWWITATPLLQVTDHDAEPDFQLRVLFGFHF